MISAQFGIVLFEFVTLFGRADLVTFTQLLVQLASILIAFPNVLMNLALVLPDFVTVLNDFLVVRPELGVALRSRVCGMSGQSSEGENGADSGNF